MLHITFINKIINSLKSRRLPKVTFHYNKLILETLRLLKNEKLLHYKIISVTTYPSPLMEMDIITSTIKNLTSISRPGLTKSISYQELKKIPFLCLINTDKGLLTKEQAIQLKTGGQLLLKYQTFWDETTLEKQKHDTSQKPNTEIITTKTITPKATKAITPKATKPITPKATKTITPKATKNLSKTTKAITPKATKNLSKTTITPKATKNPSKTTKTITPKATKNLPLI